MEGFDKNLNLNDDDRIKITYFSGEDLNEMKMMPKWIVMCNSIIKKAKQFFFDIKEGEKTNRRVNDLTDRLKKIEEKNKELEEKNKELEEKINKLRGKVFGDEIEKYKKYADSVRTLWDIVDSLKDVAVNIAQQKGVCETHEYLAKYVSGEISILDDYHKNEMLNFKFRERISSLLDRVKRFNNEDKQTIINYLSEKKYSTFDNYVYVPQNKKFDQKVCEPFGYEEIMDGGDYSYVITPYVALPDFPDSGKQDVKKAIVSNKKSPTEDNNKVESRTQESNPQNCPISTKGTLINFSDFGQQEVGKKTKVQTE